jgi:adenylylsulfate kinase
MIGFAVWITGLPGCGKSTIARELATLLAARGVNAVHLEMDARRRAYFPNPTYSAQEREAAYARLVDEAAALAATGRAVILDATAPRLAQRDAARGRIPRFLEAQVRCPLELAMAREAARPRGKVMAGLYAQALERRRSGVAVPGLGLVPGVDVPCEENPAAEVVIDAERDTPQAAARRIVAALEPWLGE